MIFQVGDHIEIIGSKSTGVIADVDHTSNVYGLIWDHGSGKVAYYDMDECNRIWQKTGVAKANKNPCAEIPLHLNKIKGNMRDMYKKYSISSKFALQCENAINELKETQNKMAEPTIVIPVAKCECGAEAVGVDKHSDWCPKHGGV
jgi:hypothetical protein